MGIFALLGDLLVEVFSGPYCIFPSINDTTIEDIRSRVNFNLQDDAQVLKPNEKELAIRDSIRVYSKDKPQKLIHEDDTADNDKYDFDLPNAWINDFSTIVGDIEYPVSDDIQNPHYVDSNAWLLYEKLSGKVLRFVGFIPASGYTIRFKFIAPHTVTDTNCTIPDNDLTAVCELATAFCYRALAAKYAQTEAPTIEADVIDYARKADEYMTLAESAFGRYQSHVKGTGEEGKKPAAVAFKDLDISLGGPLGALTHRPINR